VVALMGCFGGKNVKKNETPEEKLQRAKMLLDKNKAFKAFDILDRWVIENSGSPLRDKARFWLGLAHFKMKEYLIAISEFNRLIQEMPESPLVADAQYYIALSYYKLSPFPELDQEYTKKALREFQLFIETFPDHPNVKDATEKIMELREKLAKKELKNAELYRKIGRYKSALIYYQEVINNYYDLPEAETALFYSGKLQYKLKHFKKAQSQLNIYLNKYPNGKFAMEAKMILEKLEDKKQ
jgi:outer membrane protein assembly factor BamD